MTRLPLSSIEHRRCRQRGDFLLEALIAMLLAVIVVTGALYMSSRALVAQRNMQMQQIAIGQMKEALMSNGTNSVDICTTPPVVQLPGMGALTVTVTGCGVTSTVTVNGVTMTGVPQPLTLSVTSAALGGEVRVGSGWGA